jgi:hypothetical protein
LIKTDTLYSDYGADRASANSSAIVEQLGVLRSFLDLGSFPPAFQDKVGGEAATELIDILNRLPQDAILSGPTDPVGTEPQPNAWTIPGTEIALARKTDGLNAGTYVIELCPKVGDGLSPRGRTSRASSPDEEIEGGIGRGFGFGHPDVFQMRLGLGLDRLGHGVQNVGLCFGVQF